MEKNKIILTAETDFQDNKLRAAFRSMSTKIDTLNDRTKRQTIQIKDLEERLRIMGVEYGREMQT